MAIGVARFWGIRLPENFNWPFVSRNLSEFWNRWHITLSHILRDYLYYTLSLAVKRRKFFRRHVIAGLVAPPVITFLIAGIWHGAGLNFIIFGLLHGVGLAVVALLQRYSGSSPFVSWWKTSRIGYVLATAMTFSYVTLTLIFMLPVSRTCCWRSVDADRTLLAESPPPPPPPPPPLTRVGSRSSSSSHCRPGGRALSKPGRPSSLCGRHLGGRMFAAVLG